MLAGQEDRGHPSSVLAGQEDRGHPSLVLAGQEDRVALALVVLELTSVLVPGLVLPGYQVVLGLTRPSPRILMRQSPWKQLAVPVQHLQPTAEGRVCRCPLQLLNAQRLLTPFPTSSDRFDRTQPGRLRPKFLSWVIQGPALQCGK